MKSKDYSINIEFKHSGGKKDVSLTALTKTVIEFFDIYGTVRLAGKQFCSITGDGDGSERFSYLLKKTGYPDDPEGFFIQILASFISTLHFLRPFPI